MPRAQAQAQAILERISVVRQSINDLNDRLYQLEQVCDSYSLASFIHFTLRLQTRSSVEPDYKAQLEVEEQRIRVVRSRYSELTSKVRQSALFPRHSNHTFPSSTSYYQRQKNLTSILQKTKPRHTSPLPPRS